MNSYLNTEIKVLFEENDGEYWKGHTSNYLIVKVKSEENLINRIENIKINNVIGLELEGIVTKRKKCKQKVTKT